METINAIELCDPDVAPTDEVLRGILGSSWGAYQSLLEIYRKNDMTTEWRYYRDGKAWLCKVQCKKRTIVWMSAWNGYMQATIYIPEKYIDDVYGLELSKAALDSIKQTKNTGKSKPCIFRITSDGALEDFQSVMQFKLIAK